MNPLLRTSQSLIKFKLQIYKIYTRPVIIYATPGWDFISKTNMNRLHVVQDRCGSWKDIGTRIERTHSDHKIHMLKSYIKCCFQNYIPTKSSRNRYIKKFDFGFLVDNTRVPKPSHILMCCDAPKTIPFNSPN